MPKKKKKASGSAKLFENVKKSFLWFFSIVIVVFVAVLAVAKMQSAGTRKSPASCDDDFINKMLSNEMEKSGFDLNSNEPLLVSGMHFIEPEKVVGRKLTDMEFMQYGHVQICDSKVYSEKDGSYYKMMMQFACESFQDKREYCDELGWNCLSDKIFNDTNGSCPGVKDGQSAFGAGPFQNYQGGLWLRKEKTSKSLKAANREVLRQTAQLKKNIKDHFDRGSSNGGSSDGGSSISIKSNTM